MDVALDFVLENSLLSLGISTVIILLFVYAAINVYFGLKKGFHISVNCWFCNQNSRILYSKRNNFVCELCCQYNGFDKDGGYNKVIEAQYDISKIITGETATSTSRISSNGLCDTCNRNHELKVIQLSQFDPMNCKNYDSEVRHFEEQLEKCYGLCETCSKTLEKTIREQNEWIFGNKLQNSKKFKLVTGQDSKKFSLSVINMFLFVLSFVNVVILTHLDDFLPKKSTLPGNVILSNLYLSINNITTEYLAPNILDKIKHFQYLDVLVLGSLGFIIEFSTIFAQNNFSTNFDQLFSWFILTLIASIDPKNKCFPYLDYLEIVCSLYLTFTYAATCMKRNKAISYSESLNNTGNTSFASSESSQNHSNINRPKAGILSMSNETVIIDNPILNQLQQQSPHRNLSVASAITRNTANNTIFNNSSFSSRTLGPAKNIAFDASDKNICGFKTATGKSGLNTYFNELKIETSLKELQRPLNSFKIPQSHQVFNQNTYLLSPLPQSSKLSLNSDNHAFSFHDQNPRAASIRKESMFSTNLFNQETASCLVDNHNSFKGLLGLHNFPSYTATFSASLRRERLINGSVNHFRSLSNFNSSNFFG